MKFFFISILLFMYLYDPSFNFFPISSGIIVTFLAFFYFIFIKKFRSMIFEILKNKYIILSFVSLLFLNIYYVLLTLFSGYNHLNFRFIIMLLRYSIELPLLSFFFLYIINNYNHSKLNLNQKIFKFFITVGVSQFFFVFNMFFFTDFRNFVFTKLLFLREGHDKILSMGDFSLRGFGISKDYLFSTPLAQGFISILSLMHAIRKNYYFFLIFFLIFLSSIVNARVAILNLFFFTISLILVDKTKLLNIKNRSSKVFITGLFVLFLIVFYAFQYLTGDTFIWIIEGFTNVFEANNSVNVLFNNHIHFPKKAVDIFFGKGLIVFSNPNISFSSDIGYIINIYFGGLISLFLFFVMPISLYIGSKKLLDKNQKILFISLFLILIFSHLKGNIFNFNSFTKVFFIIYFSPFVLLYNRVTKNVVKTQFNLKIKLKNE
jgi:hypothetical protein